jgi:hypothetical protein
MARTRKQISAQNLFKYDVLIEDQSERSDYFKLSQFSGYFTGGRNAFLVAGSPVLKPNTKLLVEVLDKNNRAIFSAPVKDFIEANSRLVQVEVYEDTPIGQGKLVILGCAVTYADGTPVPREWQNKYNVRWISNVTISPQKENTTPIRFNTPPTMVVREKFYFAPESSSFSFATSASLDINLNTKFFNVFPNGYLLTSKGVPNERYFTKYLGGVFTGSVEINGGNGKELINVNIPITRIYNRFIAESDGTLLKTDVGTVITDLYVSSSGQYTTIVNKTYVAEVTSSVVLQYNELITQNTGSLISFADIRVVDLSTVSGEVNAIQLSYKRTTEPGEYNVFGEVSTTVRELLAIDSASRISETGRFRDIALKDYWYSTTMSLSRTDSAIPPAPYYTASLITAETDNTLQSCFFLLDAITGQIPIINGQFTGSVSYTIGTRETTPLELFPRSEYTLSFDALVSNTSASITLSQPDYSVDVYLVPLSGSNTTLLDTNPRGQLLGTLTPESGFSIQNFETVDLNFVPKIIAPGTFGLRFIVYGGFWNIANVSVTPATERFFSPDEISILIPNEFAHDELVTYRAEYLDINNNSLGIQTTALPTFFDGIGYVSRQGDTMFGELFIEGIPVYNSLLESSFTGLTSGGIITLNPNYSQAYDISAGNGIIVDNSSNPLDPIYQFVSWPALTAVTASAFASSGSVASWPRTQIAISASGEIIEQQNTFTLDDYRNYIVLGRIAHVNSRTIQRTLSLPLTTYANQYHWFDLAYSIGIINLNGNTYSAAGTNRTIQKTSGQTYRIGSNYKFDTSSPDVTDDIAINPVTFAYRYQSGSSFVEQPVTTEITGSLYDNGSGTLQTVNNNQWTIQRIYFFGATATTRIQYGQFVYNSLIDATAAVFTELFVADPNLEQDATLRAYLIVRGGATNLSLLGDAEFITAKSGLAGSSGGGGATSLTQLSDVDIVNPQNGDILVYNSSSEEWKNTSRFPYTGSAAISGSLHITANVTASSYIIPVALEPSTITATAAGGTVNFEALTNSVVYYTQAATSNWTLNIRGNSTTTLDSIMTNGETRTLVFLATNGVTPYYQTEFAIDGNVVTAKWQGGDTPTYGTANAVDIYSFSIIKTNTATFSVFGSKVYFA